MNNPSDAETMTPVTIGALMVDSARRLAAAGVDSPDLAVELLMRHLLGVSRAALYTRREDGATASVVDAFQALVARRLGREPIAYIIGSTGFWDLDLRVTDQVLVPRPDTETLVAAALELLTKSDTPLRVVDLGTGSGAIALSLAKACPHHDVYASDRSATALAVAQQNASLNGLSHRVSFVQGSWFAPFDGAQPLFDMVVSNPPYIPSADIDSLEPEVSVHEPRSALDGDLDGLRDLGLIIDGCRHHLKLGGWLLMEMGWDQRELVRGLLESSGIFCDILFFDDYAGNNRAVRARRC